MSLQAYERHNYATLLRAAEHEALCLVECHDRQTGARVPVLCAVNVLDEHGEIGMVPLAKLFTGDPYEELVPPIDDDQPGAN